MVWQNACPQVMKGENYNKTIERLQQWHKVSLKKWQRKAINALVRKSKLIQVQEIKKFRGRPKIILVEVIKKDLSAKGVIENMTSYKTE